MAGRGLTDERWLEEQSAGAPSPLRDRAEQYLARQPAGPLPLRLAQAAQEALNAVLAVPGGGDRSVALDLLTADALVTLALKAKAAQQPEEVASFASKLRGRGQGSGVRDR